MRILMVPVANRPECVAAMRTTFNLARRLGACIQACHVRPHRYSAVVLPPEAAFALSDQAVQEAADRAEESAKQAANEARQMVDDMANDAGFSVVRRIRGGTDDGVVWSEQVGDPQHLMRVIGPFSDLLVVSRPSNKRSYKARQFLEAALLDSSRPVLVLPPRGARSVGERVVIAWDRTHNAMLAVIAAMPILQKAESVTVLTSGHGKEDGPKASRLVAYLSAWGIDAEHVQTRGARANPVKDIDATCEKAKADLLVMGSYSRSRLRERIFGGVTEHMLNNTKRPILTIHNG
ncbi:MAG: universal stress protein [Pseudomonadota bacterium]